MTTIRSDSFLKNTTVLNGVFLDLNRLPRVPRHPRDELYEIGHGYDERPDLLAYKIYGNSRLWWVFALRNPDIIKDPIRDFKAGKTIVLPAEEVVTRLS